MKMIVSSTFQGRDLAVLKTVITYLVCEIQWKYSDSDRYDIHFSNKDSEYFVEINQQNKQIPLGKKIDPKSLRQLFDHLNSVLKSTKTKEDTKDLAHFLFELNHDAKSQYIKIRHHNQLTLINTSEQTVVSTHPFTDIYLKALANNSDISYRKVLSYKKHYNKQEVNYTHSLSLKQFLWALGNSCSNKFLLNKMFSSNIGFYLTDWPDFGTYSHNPYYISVCAYLQKNTDTFPGIAESNQLTDEEVTRFINASLLSGCVATTNQLVNSIKKKSSKTHPSFLGKLKRVILGLQNS